MYRRKKEYLNIGDLAVLLKTEPRALQTTDKGFSHRMSSVPTRNPFPQESLKINIFDLGSRLNTGPPEKYLDGEFLPIFGSKILRALLPLEPTYGEIS